MAFSPANVIKLRHVPFDDTYTNVFDFDGVNSQYNYFNGLGGYDLTNFTYQRKDSIIRVPVNAESLYNINYVIYQNANFGNKWFYAFVTKIEYVNDNTSFLHIKTDVWQTWLFDWHVNECFVERMHVPYDTEGEWTEPEPINIDTYPIDEQLLSHNGYFGNQNIILYFSKNPPSLSGVLETNEDSGAYSATWYKMYYVAGSVSPYQACLADIALLEAAGEMELICGYGTSFNDVLADQFSIFTPVYKLPSGGVAKNNKSKLYCYSMVVGNSTFKADLATVNGDTLDVTSRINGGTNPFMSVEITNVPGHPIIEYNNFPVPKIPLNTDINNISRSLRISMETLPFQIMAGGLGALASSVGGGSGGGMNLSSLVSPLQGMITTAGQYAISDIMPKQLSGYAPGNGRFSAARAGIYQIYYAPKRSEFNNIDNFFSAFGYAINDVRHPIFRTNDLSRRANFNYIKTSGVAIIATGGIVQEDYSDICRILDSGVTVWHNPSAYGNLLIANDPV